MVTRSSQSMTRSGALLKKRGVQEKHGALARALLFIFPAKFSTVLI
jgi:hypothetical protein